MARKEAGESTREHVVGARVTPDEKRLIRAAASKRGIPVSVFLRDPLVSYARDVLEQQHPQPVRYDQSGRAEMVGSALSADEHRDVQAAAEKLGVTQSTLLAHCAVRAAKAALTNEESDAVGES